MNQEDINDLIAKNPSPEGEINSRPTYGYSKGFILEAVDTLFSKYANQYRTEAKEDMQKLLKEY